MVVVRIRVRVVLIGLGFGWRMENNMEPYFAMDVHIKHTTAYNGTDVHRNLLKNYQKHSNNNRIWFRIRVRYGVRVSV